MAYRFTEAICGWVFIIYNGEYNSSLYYNIYIANRKGV